MNSFGDAPHSFPRGPRGRRRPRRHPPWVRPHLANSPCSTSTTTTTSTTSTSRHKSRLALQPITRFSQPQDSSSANGVPVSAIFDMGCSKDILLNLQAASLNLREQAFWNLCLQMFDLFECNRLPVHIPWTKIFLSRQYPAPQTDLVLYNPATRYQQEFEEEEELGRGGFGRVVRARKKLDGRCYAVKMIITEDLGSESSLEACVSEVRTLAELDHPRVVRYYTAWVQHEVWSIDNSRNAATVMEISTSDTQDDSTTDSSDENDMFLRPPEPYQGKSSGSPGEDSVVFQETEPGEGEHHAASHRVTPIHQHPRSTPVKHSGQLLPFGRRVSPLSKKVLYIQMRLYGKPLRKWIDERNDVESPVVVEAECLSIFSQMVEAVCYIHQEGYIHRDIKPANILFTLDGSDVQLGDFGLARLITHPSSDSSNTSLTLQTLHPLTLNVGTPLYTAPEVKQGNYGEKSDMYSLGIILLELFMPFKTKYEMSVVINDLKLKGDLDPDFKHHWPSIAHWIRRLVDQDPENRPTAKELLESSLFPQPLPPPAPTTTTGVIDVRRSGPSLTQGSHVMDKSTSIITQTKFSAVSTTQTTHISTENGVNMSSFDVTEHLSKDDQIALLKKENDALKRELEAIRRDFQRCQISNTTQPDDY